MSYRDDLLAAMEATAIAISKPTPVQVKGWGTVYMRPITVGEMEERQKDVLPPEFLGDKYNAARSAARLFCDEDGNRIFNEHSKEDLELLYSKISRQELNLVAKVFSEPTKEIEAAAEGN